MIKNFFHTAWRHLWKNRSASLLSITGLSAGMTASLLIFLWVQNELSYDNYHPHADRTYRITSYLTNVKWVWSTSPLPLAAALQQQLPEVEKATATRTVRNMAVRIGDQLFTEKNGAYIDSNWFDLFHYDFVQGNPANFYSSPYSVALTSSAAKKYFGSHDAIGQTIRFDTLDYRVAAIVKDNPANSSFQYDILMPLAGFLADPRNRKEDMEWGNFYYRTFVRLRPGADFRKVTAALSPILTHDNINKDSRAGLIPLKEMHFETGLTNTTDERPAEYKSVYIFSILGSFLLVIACINYVNLTTARASRRAKEVSIRKVIGAGKKSLFGQFIAESLLISLLSILVTALLVRLSLPYFRELTGKHFEDPLRMPVAWEMMGATLFAATLLNGIYPALLLSSFQPLQVFKGVSILKVKDAGLRKGLVVLQFTFSVVLIICTLIIQRQMNYIQTEDPGYRRSQLFSFTIPYTLFRNLPAEERYNTWSAMRHELLASTSIAATTLASQSPVNLTNTNAGSADWEGHDTSFRPTIFRLSADENFNTVLQLQLQQGRWFQPGSSLDRHNFILNETAVSDFRLHTPVIGQRFIFQRDTGVIIGIVKDFHFASFHNRIGDLVIINRPQDRRTFFVKTQPGKTPQALAAAKQLWQRYLPELPFEYIFQDELFDQLYKDDRRLSTMVRVFSAIAILISSLGLFGLSAFAAERRTKEIGIRKVLGATVSSLVMLLSGDFLRLVLLSVVIASPIAGWTMHRWLQDFAYHVPLSSWIFLLAGCLALLIATAAVSYQAIKAARSNPVKNLRTE